MLKEKTKKVWILRVIIPCLIIIIAITLSYYFDNRLFLTFSLINLGLFFLFNNMTNAFYILLVFIPFNNILKFSPESFAFLSILSIEFLLISIFEMMRNKYEIKAMFLVQIMFLLMLSLISFNINSNHLAEFTINFVTLINLAFLCTIIKRINYKKAIFSYIFGFLCASISGLIIGKLPHMYLFINNFAASRELNTIFRFTGVDQDANYFGFYSLFAISLLIVLKKTKEMKKSVIISFVILVSIIFGFLSYSKMFMIILVFIFLLVLLSSLKSFSSNGKNIKNILVFTTLLAFGYIYFKQLIFTRLINPYLNRFVYSVDGGELTNGRLEIFLLYGKEIMSDIFIITLGTGFFRNDQELTLASHNTYITIMYTFGVIGTVVLIAFYRGIFKQIKTTLISIRNKKVIVKESFSLYVYYPLFIMLLTMLALDLLYMRFFPYLIFLSFLIINKNHLQNG